MIKILKISKPNCRPCAIMANYLSEIDFGKYDAELTEVNIADHPEVVEKYGLTGVPVLILFRNDIEVTRMVGLHPAEEVIDAVEHAKEVR